MFKSVILRRAARIVHDSIMESCVEQNWPPTPQEILESDPDTNKDLLNLISWIVHPRGKLNDDGNVVVPESKKSKIFHLANNIECLLPGVLPSLEQILFATTLHAKSGSKDAVDTTHSFGYGISHSELYFILDKWAEWAEAQSSIIPKNIQKKVVTTHIADNIDFKNKNIEGNETHNTNSILVQHTCNSRTASSKISLTPDYDFIRKDHRSYKAKTQELKPYTGRKKVAPMKLLNITSSEKTEFQRSTMKNQAWVTCRMNNVVKEEIQIPAWSAFQKMTTSENAKMVDVGYLPPIMGSPTKMDVVLEIMNRSMTCMSELELDYIFLVADQAIYAKVLEILFDYKERGMDTFKGLIVRMGGFHVQMCLMKSIYSRFKDCGLVRLLSECGIGSEGTIRSAMNGGDVKAGIRYYKILYEAFMRLKIKSQEQPINDEGVACSIFADLVPKNIEKMIDQLKSLTNLPGEMAKWIDSFLEMVNLLLNIIHFQRIGNWEGYLQCLDEFLPWCFALNRHNYARDLSFYVMDMKNLKLNNPEAYQYLVNGGFSGSLSGEKHTQIPMDQIIETTVNRSCKEIGGIIGKTENQGATERWMRVSHILAALKEQQNKKVYKKPKFSKHRELEKKRMVKDEDDVQRVVSGIETWVPDLWNNSPLVHLSDGIVASEEMVANVLSAKENGKKGMNDFIARFTSSEHKFAFSDPIKKQPVHVFETMTKSKTKENSIPEDECESFGSVLAIFENIKLDLKYLMNWCLTSKPWMICKEYGKSRDPNKSLFRNNLLLLNPTKGTNTTPTDINCCIADGGRLLHLLGISNLKEKTFKAWAETICNYLESLPGNILHIAFDNYEEPETVILSKGRIKSGRARKLNNLSQTLPPVGEWAEFLSIDENKQQLIKLLCDFILRSSKVQKKKYITKVKQCFTISNTLDF